MKFLISDSNTSAAAETTRKAPPCGASGPAQPPAAGLVSLKTSDTLIPRTVEIDSDKARHTRLKRSILVAAKLFEHSFRGFRVKPAMLKGGYRHWRSSAFSKALSSQEQGYD